MVKTEVLGAGKTDWVATQADPVAAFCQPLPTPPLQPDNRPNWRPHQFLVFAATSPHRSHTPTLPPGQSMARRMARISACSIMNSRSQ